jgi:feruloyl esterase
MKGHHLKTWLTTLEEKPHLRRACSLSIVGWIAFLAFVGLSGPALAAQDARVEAQTQDTQKCDALAELNLEATPGGPAVITSAHLVEVPASGLARWTLTPSGYASSAPNSPSPIHQYCDVTGYAAPQNKFELKLPLSGDWNQKFFFYACGAFCGTVFGDACNLGLSRGYASVTGNGGHDSAWGFDGVWAANAPELQEDFGWRSNHVVTLIAKAITTHYYGKSIKHSYMGGGSKGAGSLSPRG